MLKRGLAFGGILAILSGVGIYNNIYAVTEGTTKFSVDVNNAILELTVPSNPAVIDLNPTMTNASFGSTSINIHVATNNITGYTLTMTPTNNTEATSLIRTELIGDEQNYREIETLELTDPVSTGYTEQTFTANKWGYKITGDNYYGIDPENTTVSHPAWVTNAPTNGTNHNLTLAAKVDADTVSGAYETTLNFRAVTNAVVAKDTVVFNKNNNDASGSMENITVVAGDTTPLPANTFAAPIGYRFTGWSTTADGLGENVRYYGDGSPYTAIDTGVSKQVTLYAQWVPSFTPVIPGIDVDPEHIPEGGTVGTTFARAYEIAYTAMHKGMYEQVSAGSTHYEVVDSWNPTDPEQYKNLDVRFAMQDMTPEICASVTAMHDDYQALDVRDDKLYHITKLKDGKCWMTQNLDLNLSPEKTLNHFDTDLGWNTPNEAATWTPVNSTLPPSDIVDGYFQNANSTMNYPISYDVGDWYFTDTWYSSNECPSDNNSCNYLINNNSPYFKTTPFTKNGTHGHVGNYYNIPATFARNYMTNTEQPYHLTSDSICPAGWRLSYNTPYGYRVISEYQELDKYYPFVSYGAMNRTDEMLLSAPLFFVRAGYLQPGNKTLATSGYSGYYWVNGSYSSWGDIVSFYYDGIYGGNSSTTRSHQNGYQIRCVAR